MRKTYVLLIFLMSVFTLAAQHRLSLFIGNANQYASVDLTDYKSRLCREYNVADRSLQEYYRHCGRDWGNVGLVLEIARTSGRSVRDVCDYYRRYHRHGWDRILVEIGIRPGSRYYAPFYDRVGYHSDCWHRYYGSYCDRHDRYHPKKHKYKRPKYKRPHHRPHPRNYRWDDDDDDDDDD